MNAVPPATSTRRLPRSLDPLPEESLPGYLLRLAHRLDLPPIRVAVLTGLAAGHVPHVPASRMVEMDPDMVHTFATATRLADHEAAGLTLAGPGGRGPDTAPPALRSLARIRTWVFTGGTRYCPQCLAGDGSQIQARHGGAWHKLWRLAPVFACTTHQRLLEHTCPACGHLALAHTTAGPAQILPRPRDPTLHPAQCRAALADGSACTHRLDAPDQHPAAGGHCHLLILQERLDALLHPAGPAAVNSAGRPTTPARYLADLRLVAALAQASWPHSRATTDLHGPAAELDRYLTGGRREADLRHLRQGIPRTTTTHDTPPVDPTACGSLLALAAEILDSADARTAHERLAPLAAHAPALRTWARKLLADTGPCSPALRAAAGLQPRRTEASGRPPTEARRRRFGHRHIPAHLTPEWHARYFSGLGAVNPQSLRRAAAVTLTQMCEGCTAAEAADILGLPPPLAASAADFARRLTTREGKLFHRALGELAGHLDTATHLIDYGRRRHATRTWVIAPTTWAELAGSLARDLARGGSRHNAADWSDRKRLFATVVVWTRVTRGEHFFAPALDPGPHPSRQVAEVRRYVLWAWRSAHGRTEPSSHYVPLIERLDALAADLAAEIDTGRDLPE